MECTLLNIESHGEGIKHTGHNAYNDFVAQLVEHNTFNVRVIGSSPIGVTNYM